MFQALQPLLNERSIHILLSPAGDGRIGVYVEPVKRDDKEDKAFTTPFRCEGTPEELDAELPGVLAQWLTSRATLTTSLRDALAAAEAEAKAAAEEAKKKSAERNKKTPAAGKPASVPAKGAPAQAVTPSLLDGGAAGDYDEGREDGQAAGSADNAPAAPSASAPLSAVEAQAATVTTVESSQSTAQAPSPSVAAIVSAEPITDDLF